LLYEFGRNARTTSQSSAVRIDGEQCMLRQRKVVDQMERQGFDTLNAILFLEYLEEMQAQYLALRDRLERQLLVLVRPEE
jgi:hypothetical protein